MLTSTKTARRRARRIGRAQQLRYRGLRVEGLEERQLLSTFDLGPLRLSGNLTANGTQITGTGTIEAGFVPKANEPFKPLLDVSGSLSFDTAATPRNLTVDGDVQAIIGGNTTTLLSSHHVFDVDALVNQGLAEADAKSLTVAGATFTLGKIRLESPGADTTGAQISLQGSIAIPQLAGLNVSVDDPNKVIIDTVNGVSLTGLNASINAPFTAFGTTFTPTALTIGYTSATQTFAVYGGASAAVSGNTLAVDLGTQQSPGILVQNGAVQSINAGVTADLSLFGLGIHPTGLTLAYDAPNAQYELFGSATVSTSGNAIAASFGTQAQPGVVIQNGAIQSLNLGVSTDFTLFGLAIHPTNLTFVYDKAQSQYEMSGGLTVNTSGNSIAATLGTAQSPGLVIQNGAVQGVNLAVTADMAIFGLTVSPNNLTFVYDSKQSQYEMSGGVTVKTSGNSIAASLGTAASPGLIIQNGAIQSVNFAVTADMSLFGLTVTPNNLTFVYDSKQSQYEMSGGLTVKAPNTTIAASLGTAANPGLIITAGAIQSINFTVNADMTLAGLTVHADSVDFVYDAKQSQYEMSGGVTVKPANATIVATLGTAAAPGLVIQNGAVQSVNFAVNADMTLAGLTAHADNVTFVYDSNLSQYEMSGAVTVKAPNTTIAASLGTAASPGLIIQNGAIQSVNFAVTADMTLAGLTVHADSVTFVYDAKNAQYAMSGGVTIKASNANFAATLGTTANPGLIIQNGAIQSVNFAVNADMTLAGLTVHADNVTFVYDSKLSQYEMSGAVTVKATNATITGTLGSAANPGLVIQNNTLQSLNLAVNGTMTVAGLTLQATNATFIYDAKNAQYEVFGSVKANTSGNSIIASLGTQQQPGLVIKNGAIQSVNLGLTADFTLFGVTIHPNSLTFVYDAAQSQYEIYGNLNVNASNNAIAANLGTQQQPGLVIKNGSIQSVNFGLSGDFTVFGLTIHPDSLTFVYDANVSRYEIYGGATVKTSNQSITATLGDQQHPGLVIKGGSVQNVNFGLTADFTLFGVAIHPNGLTFVYDAAQSQYEIYGSLTVKASNQSIAASLGTAQLPGLVIKNGSILGVNLGLTADITLFGVSVHPESLTFVYDAGQSQYEIYGSLTVKTSSQSITANLGNQQHPGLVIKNGSILGVNMGVTANLNLFGVTIQPNNLTFVYDAAQQRYELYGSLTVQASGQSIAANLGTAQQPGLTIQNGSIQGVNMGVTANISLFGVTIQPNNLTFVYDAPKSQYEIYGSLTVIVSGQSITASLGDQQSPGLVIQNGSIQSVNIAISSDITVFGLNIHANGLGMKYEAALNRYELFGGITLTKVFSASATIGTAQQPGIVIQNGQFHVENLTISLSNVSIGAFTLKNLSLSYQTTASGTNFSISAIVAFPLFEVGGSLVFINGNLDSIAISYNATSQAGLIPIGDTGLFLKGIGASVSGLASPNFSQLQVAGYASFVFGGLIGIGGRSVTLLRVDGDILINKDMLSIDVGVYLGAYEDGGTFVKNGIARPSVQGLIAQGNGKLTLNWSQHKASLVISNASFFGGLITFSGGVLIDGQNSVFGIRATASAQIPNSIPFIGGTKFGSLSFAFVYHTNNGSGFAAVWTTIDIGVTIWGHHIGKYIKVGVQYNLGGGFSFIRDGSVDSVDSATQFILNGFGPGGGSGDHAGLPGSADNGSNISSLDLAVNGAAAVNNGELDLTSGAANQSGTAWLPSPQVYANGFDSTFQFKLTSPSEGFAFVLQRNGVDALGGPGSQLGYGGAITQALAIKFGSHKNDDTDDPSGNYISVNAVTNSDGANAKSAVALERSLPIQLADGNIHTAEVKVTPALGGDVNVDVYLDGSTTPVLETIVNNLDKLLGGDGQTAFFGFSGSTGDVTGTTAIVNWTLTQMAVPPYSPYDYPGFSDSTGLDYAGSAQAINDVANLTSKGAGQTGAVWTDQPVDVTKGFRTVFQYRMTPGGSGGLAFVIQNDPAGNQALGQAPAQNDPNPLSFLNGIQKGVAVGLLASPTPDATGLSGNGVGLFTPSNGVLHGDAANLKAAITDLTYHLNDGQLHNIVIEYDPVDNDRLNIFAGDDGGSTQSSVSVDGLHLSQILGGNTGYLGLVAGNANDLQETQVTTWLTDVATTLPRTMPGPMPPGIVHLDSGSGFASRPSPDLSVPASRPAPTYVTSTPAPAAPSPSPVAAPTPAPEPVVVLAPVAPVQPVTATPAPAAIVVVQTPAAHHRAARHVAAPKAGTSHGHKVLGGSPAHAGVHWSHALANRFPTSSGHVAMKAAAPGRRP